MHRTQLIISTLLREIANKWDESLHRDLLRENDSEDWDSPFQPNLPGRAIHAHPINWVKAWEITTIRRGFLESIIFLMLWTFQNQILFLTATLSWVIFVWNDTLHSEGNHLSTKIKLSSMTSTFASKLIWSQFQVKWSLFATQGPLSHLFLVQNCNNKTFTHAQEKGFSSYKKIRVMLSWQGSSMGQSQRWKENPLHDNECQIR